MKRVLPLKSFAHIGTHHIIISLNRIDPERTQLMPLTNSISYSVAGSLIARSRSLPQKKTRKRRRKAGKAVDIAGSVAV
jgi:hypothetical protein